jgi:hypothetical protein
MKKIDHIEHVEDLLLTKDANLVPELLKASPRATIKYDGSPSIVAGIDPSDGKFFVATKGIFNKTPVYYKRIEDLDSIKSVGLAWAMGYVFDCLSKLSFKSIYQGDLMWIPEDLYINGDVIEFQTNTILYSVPRCDPMFDRIKNSTIGVVWHTRYEGGSVEDLHVANDLHKFDIPESEQVVSLMPELRNGKDPFVREMVNKIHVNEIPEELVVLLKRFLPKSTRNNFIKQLLVYVYSFYDMEETKRTSLHGKQRVLEREEEICVWIYEHSLELNDLKVTYDEVVSIKNEIIEQLENRALINASSVDNNKCLPTKQEGYVVKIDGLVAKLVDRNEFTIINRLNSLNRRRQAL